MNRNALFAASLLALSTLAGAAIAAAPAGASTAPQRVQLDRNADGAIDRAEAATSPRLVEHFDRLDKDGDGRLSAAERPRHGDRGHGRGGKHGSYSGDRIVRMDRDKDGRLSRAEIGSTGRLASDFAAIDRNNDGHIVRAELRAWHASQRPKMEAARAKRMAAMFDGADLNRDGKLSRVEVDSKLPRMADRFAWVDDNKDGFLSRAELTPERRR